MQESLIARNGCPGSDPWFDAAPEGQAVWWARAFEGNARQVLMS